MATKMFYVTRDMKHPLYKGRMLTAGDPLELDGPTARLYKQLKAITDEKPKAKREPVAAAAEAETVKVEAPKPKRAPRKRKAKAKA